MKNIKTYSEMIQLPTFEERLQYVKTNSNIGYETFGSNRYINQRFYKSKIWLDEIRPSIIIRDSACDLAVPGYDIFGRVYIHHLNPITIDDIIDMTEFVTNPEYLVCVSFGTHNLLHFSSNNPLMDLPKERSMYDMCPWKKG